MPRPSDAVQTRWYRNGTLFLHAAPRETANSRERRNSKKFAAHAGTMATQTDYVGQVQGRMESLADGFMARAISLAQADMAVLDEQLEHARKKLRGEKGALVTASSAMVPPTRAPLATITEASNSPRIEAAAAKPAPRAPPAAAAARPSPTTNGNDSVAKARALVESYTFKELQRELKSRELRAAGKKQELKARLETALVAELDASKKSAPMEEEEVVEAPPAPAPAPKASPRAAPDPKAASPAPKAASPPPALKAAPAPKPASPRVASPKPAPQKAAAAPPRAPPPLPPRPASPAPPRSKSPRPAHEACADPAPESPKPGLGFVASMQSLFGGKKDGVPEPPKSAKPAAQPTPQPDRLAEVRARQLQQQKAREHAAAARERETQQRLAAEKKRRDLEEAARRVAALKRQEEVAKRRQEQREADLKRKAGMDAPPPPPTSNYSPAPAGTAGPPPPAAALLSPHRPPALASKPARLTPGPDAAAKKAAAPAKSAPQPRSPLDTYEISDREDSTDDEDENEERQRKKHMPDWARGSALREALKGQRDADPGQVFIIGGATCELAAIFKTDRSFKKRTSSQNWGADLASRGEQQRYKQDMGFESPARGPL